jgi:hypothetical protein
MYPAIMQSGTTNTFHVAIVGMFSNFLTDIHVTKLTQTTGAGIGGLALAMALHKKCISFTLYEEAEEFSAVG